MHYRGNYLGVTAETPHSHSHLSKDSESNNHQQRIEPHDDVSNQQGTRNISSM